MGAREGRGTEEGCSFVVVALQFLGALKLKGRGPDCVCVCVCVMGWRESGEGSMKCYTI